VLGVNTGTSVTPSYPLLKPYTWAYCKPSVTVARWGVLAITGVQITPTSSSGGATASFEDMPVLTGGTPSASTTAWCVAVEPIKSGKVGKVAVGGVVQCKVQIDKADDKFVACKASAAELKTGIKGEGLILWKESGTGSGKWALVRLASAGEQGIKRGTFTAPWTKSSTQTVTDAVTSGTTYPEVMNYFATVSGSGTKACAISYVGGEWILVAAECG
jgi:hypothetical protein